jgi:hypothetical protein
MTPLRPAGVLAAEETSAHSAVPDGHAFHQTILDRTGFTDPTHLVEVTTEASIDGGQTWFATVVFTASGGDTSHLPNGGLSWVSTGLPPGAGRLIRVRTKPLAGSPTLGPVTVSTGMNPITLAGFNRPRPS